METLPVLRRLLFPAPIPPHYDYDSYHGSMFWIPNPDVSVGSIPCLFIPYRSSDILIVFSHGNGCDIGGMYETMEYYKNHWKAAVLLWEYPGYGVCGGVSSEQSINATMWLLYHFIRDTLQFPIERTVFFGQSIGTGPVCHLVSHLNRSNLHVGGVILQSPYTSIKDVVKFLAGTVAASVIPNRWNNLDCVQHIVDPLFIIHGVKDQIIPTNHSEILYQHCTSQAKHLLVVNSATHNEFDHHLDIIAPINSFFNCYFRKPLTPLSNNSSSAPASHSSLNSNDASTSSNPSASPVDNPSSSFSSSSSSSVGVGVSSAPLSHPAAPLPPATPIKIDRQYFECPPDAVTAHFHRMEKQRADEAARIKNDERRRSIKNFFSSVWHAPKQLLNSRSSSSVSARSSTSSSSVGVSGTASARAASNAHTHSPARVDQSHQGEDEDEIGIEQQIIQAAITQNLADNQKASQDDEKNRI